MKILLLCLCLVIMNMKNSKKYRKTKSHMRVKQEVEPKLIAGFDSKAITPPISKCN